MRIIHWLIDELTLLTGNHLFSRLFVVSAVAFFLGFVIAFVLDWLGIDVFPFASDETKKTLEELRDLLLDDYKEQLKKQNIESDNVKRIADFCLKLQKMDNETLRRAYNGIEKEI